MQSPKTLILKIYENKTACPVPLIQSLQQVTTQEKGEDSARWTEEAMAPHSKYSCLENSMDGGAW